MSASPTPYTDRRTLLKLFGVATALGAAVGGTIFTKKHLSTPIDGMSPVVVRESLPIAPGLSKAREKSSSNLGRVISQNPAAATLISLLGFGAGSGVGYKVPEAIVTNRADKVLDGQLTERKRQFHDLLIEEQTRAGNWKSAELLEEAVDALIDFEVDALYKEASAPPVPSPAIIPGLSPDMMGALLSITGLITGARYGYQHYVDTDNMRGQHDALTKSLEHRLAGSIEGSAAPMPIRIKTDRIGNTPIRSGGTQSRSARDVLSRI